MDFGTVIGSPVPAPIYLVLDTISRMAKSYRCTILLGLNGEEIQIIMRAGDVVIPVGLERERTRGCNIAICRNGGSICLRERNLRLVKCDRRRHGGHKRGLNGKVIIGGCYRTGAQRSGSVAVFQDCRDGFADTYGLRFAESNGEQKEGRVLYQ